jgi:hypothetical protein
MMRGAVKVDWESEVASRRQGVDCPDQDGLQTLIEDATTADHPVTSEMYCGGI